MKFPPLLLSILLPSCSPAEPEEWQAHLGGRPPTPNSLVLASIKTMPQGKGYAATQKDVDRLAANVSFQKKSFQQNLGEIGPTFCSGATYLVFLRTIERHGLTKFLPEKTLTRLATLGVKDGEEIFGRWNANGPGTAKLFADLNCGVNFTSYEDAQPGDFLKMWWTNAIGGQERGHSVVYLGATGNQIHYWSANEPGGYGKKSVAKSKIKHVLFSRLTNLSKLANASRLSPKDKFLADMLRKDFTWAQVVKSCKVKTTP